MLLKPRFDYKSLKRKNVNGKRHYLLEGTDYTPMPSVTTVLDRTKPEADRLALENWKKAVGYQKANEITKEAAGRGTRMHKYLEDYIADGVLREPGTNPYSKQANKMAQTVIDNGLSKMNEVWGTEVMLCHPNIYAGTTDLVGIHEGEEAIGDFKQTNKPKKIEWVQDYFLQLTAYGEAHNALYGTNIRKGVIMVCSKDYEYQEFVINLEDYDHHRKRWWRRVEEYFET
jgi:hypothetical protein